MSPPVQSRSHVLVFLLTLSIGHYRRTGDLKTGIDYPTLKHLTDQITSTPVPLTHLEHLVALVQTNLNNLLVFLSKDPALQTSVFRSEDHSLDLVCGISEECLPRGTGGINVLKRSEFSSDSGLQFSTFSVCKSWCKLNGECRVLNQMFHVLRNIPQFWQGKRLNAVVSLPLASEACESKGFNLNHCIPSVVIQLCSSSHFLSAGQHSMRQTQDCDRTMIQQVLFSVDTVDLMGYHVLCHSEINSCVIHLPPYNPNHDTLSISHPQSSERLQDLPEFSQALHDNHCVKYPFWSKLFSLDMYNQPSCEEDQDTDHTIVNSSVLDSSVREMLLVIMVLMSVAFNYLSRSSVTEKTKNGTNAVYLRILTKSFFLKWSWHHEHDQSSVKEPVRPKDDQKPHHPWAWWKLSQSDVASWKLSPNDVLKSFIFRPWAREAGSMQCESGAGTCCSSPSLLCPSRRDPEVGFTANPHPTLQVMPAFLPNPTRDPRKDLAHVGYRLATLAVLPPSVEQSRIRLADAGFYSQGQGDEVICYSCGASHSGWRRGDDPVAIHRELSPTCPHGLQTDRELSTTTPLSTLTAGQGALHNGHSLPTTGHNGHSLPTTGHNGHSLPTTGPNGHSLATLVQSNNHSGLASSQDPLQQTQTYTGSVNTPAGNPAPSLSPEEDSDESRTRADPESARSVFTPNDPILLPNAPPPSGNEARTHERDRLNVTNGHSSPAQVSDTGTAIAAAVTAANPSGSEERHSLNTSTFPSGISTTNNSTSTITAVQPTPDGSNRGQNEARASSRPLFPTARLDLGGAVYPMFQSMAIRRRTFPRWDDSQAPPLDDVILSGMFYAGYADCVRCFYCGVGLKHWVVSDDVWDEHVRWRPECGYLRAVKGERFIRETQRRLGSEPSPSSDNRPPPPPPHDDPRSTPPSSHADGRQHSPPPPPPPNPSSNGSLSTPTTTTTTTTNSNNTTNTNNESITTNTRPNTSSDTGPQASSLSTATAAATTPTTARNTARNTVTSSLTNGQQRNGTSSGSAVVSTEAENREVLAQVREEHRQLSGRLQCAVCHRARIDTIFMPCGHLVVCENCAGSVTSCPLCQRNIRATAKVHFAE